jgi:hypothetical protein
MLAASRLLVLVVLSLLAASRTSLAQTAADAASKWGLLGTWMADCSKAANSGNTAVRYVVKEGQLFYERDLGSGASTDSNQVMSATMKPDGSIEIVVNFASVLPAQTRRFALTKGKDGRMRVISNINVASKEYSIVNGTLIASGDATPWQTRCH